MKKVFFKLIPIYSLGILFISLILYLFIISNSPNIISLNYNIPFKNSMNALAPQGWAFFTKDVGKDYFQIYEIRKTETKIIKLKASSLSQCFGLIRENRVINGRLTNIVNNINPNLWHSFKGNINDINIDSLSKVSISVKEPMIYGKFIIEKGKPLPYEWYRSNLTVYRKMEYIEIEIKK